MYYFLMHKDTKVAICKDYKIVKLLDDEFLPIGTIKEDGVYTLKYWMEERKIPNKRINKRKIEKALSDIGVNFDNTAFINFGLSLEDHFWLFPLNESLPSILLKLKSKKDDEDFPKYENINYFQNKFDEKPMIDIISGNPISSTSLATPDFTTNGMNQKYWVIRNDKRFLVKQNDKIFEYVAEKELLAAFVIYLINRCRIAGKRKVIDATDYQFEAGKNQYQNVCYSKCFTDMDNELVTYKQLSKAFDVPQINKKGKLEYTTEYYFKDNKIIQDYIDFIMVLDFLIENDRKEEDIGFLAKATNFGVMKPAPLYGNCNSFAYMNKDFSRAIHEPYCGSYVNVFGMNEMEQIQYIGKLDWIMPDLIYRESDMFLQYMFSDDMISFPNQYKENIANWFKYKIVMLAHEKKQNILEDAEKQEQAEIEKNYEEGDIIIDDET